jgi:hypothetical protein
MPKLKWTEGWYGLLVVTILALLSWFVKLVLSHPLGLQKEVLAALITGSATIIVGVVTVVVGKRIEKNRENELKLREKKVDVYEKFIKQLFEGWFWPDSTDPKEWGDNPPDVVKEVAPQMVVWGSDRVIHQYAQLKIGLLNSQDKTSGDLPEEQKQLLRGFEKVLLDIRTDLGNSNKRLTAGDLSQIFLLNDTSDL